MDGSDQERELVNCLDEQDVPVLRIPASGSATKRELPDVLIKPNGRLVAAEVKASSDDYIYVDAEEVEKLLTFCKHWDAIPVVIGRFSYDTTFYVLQLKGIDEHGRHFTRSGNVRMHREKTELYETMDRYLAILERAG